MVVLYEWKIYCIQEGIFKSWWLPEGATPPTTCPDGASHNINPDSVYQEPDSKVGDVNKVTIQENDGTTGGKFFSATHEMIASGPTGNMTTKVVRYPINRSISLGDFVYGFEQAGDIISICVGPNTVVGALLGSITNTTVDGVTYSTFPVSDTVINYSTVGYFLNLNNGTGRSLDSVITEYNRTSTPKTVTVSPALDLNGNTFAPGSFVEMTVYMIKDRRLGPGLAHLTVGESIIGGSTIPKNIPFTIRYTNNAAEPYVGRVLATVTSGDTTLKVSRGFLKYMNPQLHYFTLVQGSTTSNEVKFVTFDDDNDTDDFVTVTVSPALSSFFEYGVTPIKIKKSATRMICFSVEGMY